MKVSHCIKISIKVFLCGGDDNNDGDYFNTSINNKDINGGHSGSGVEVVM